MTFRIPYLVALVTLLVAILLSNAVAHPPSLPAIHPLQTFPLRLEQWDGQTDYFDPNTVAVLKVDDYLLRRYHHSSHGLLWLYIAYYGSQGFENRVHSPAVCLPGSGWIIANSTVTPVRIHDRTIVVNSNLIKKGNEEQLVLYWYQIHGRVVAKELQAVTFLAWTSLTHRWSDEALVRINAPIVGGPQHTLQNEVAFLLEAFPPLARLLPQ